MNVCTNLTAWAFVTGRTGEGAEIALEQSAHALTVAAAISTPRDARSTAEPI